MAFYLRKHFKAGPLRLNLSKGGLGISGGITGARIGMGPKGPYVHGGRHGLYYRKYAPKGREDTASRPQSQEVRYFVDTGLTYGTNTGAMERTSPAVPLLKGHSAVANTLLVVGVLLSLAWGASQESLWLLGGMALLTGGIIVNGRHMKQRERARQCRDEVAGSLEKKKSVNDLLQMHHSCKVRLPYRRWLDFHLFALFQDAFYGDPDYILPAEIKALEGQLSISGNEIKALKAEAFAAFLDEMMEDHIISRDEEKQLETIQRQLRISDQDISGEKHMVRQLCAFRDAIEAPLEPVDADIPLKDNETCHYHCEGRLLKERIIHQYQRNRVVYKEVGYDIDMDGQVYLCSGRLLIVDNGSRSYALNRVLDVTLSLQDHTVQIVLDGRKNPLIFSMPDVATFAGKLEKCTGVD